jgi:hypothetical protein
MADGEPLIWCCVNCGSYSQYQRRGLAEPCRKVSSQDAKPAAAKRIQDGQHSGPSRAVTVKVIGLARGKANSNEAEATCSSEDRVLPSETPRAVSFPHVSGLDDSEAEPWEFEAESDAGQAVFGTQQSFSGQADWRPTSRVQLSLSL